MNESSWSRESGPVLCMVTQINLTQAWLFVCLYSCQDMLKLNQLAHSYQLLQSELAKSFGKVVRESSSQYSVIEHQKQD